MTTATAYRPRSVTEIVDAAIQIVRRHYVPLITVVAVAYVPLLVLQMTVFRSLTNGAATGQFASSQFLLLSMNQLLLYSAVSLVWFALIDASVIAAASNAYLGLPVDLATAYRQAAPRLPSAVVAIFVKYLYIFFGFALLFFAGFYFLAMFFAVPATIVLEEKGPVAGLRRSAQLSRGLKWHALMSLALVYGLYFVLIFGAGIAFTIFGSPTAAQIFSAVTTILIYPFVPTVQMLLYYDARIRKEGYDIELLARSVGATAQQTAY